MQSNAGNRSAFDEVRCFNVTIEEEISATGANPMTSSTDQTIKTACNLCFVNCGLEVQLGGEDGRKIVKVRGDEDHPTSRGYICNKAARINYYQNNQARLLSPMRRCTDGSYEEIDWDTAIAEIAGVFSRMVGGPVHSDVHTAKVAMFVGKNPFMSNGMDKARLFLREIAKDPDRKLIVVDPRRTETADYADIHLAVTPGRDAWCMAAIIGYIVQNKLLPLDWLKQHTQGLDKVIARFQGIPVASFARFAGLEPDFLMEAARIIGEADSFALEEDLGVQMAPHSTLVTYLDFLLPLLTGNYGKPGTMDMVTQLAPIIATDFGPVDDQGYELSRRTLPVTGAPIVSGLYPGAHLAEEILNDHPERPRAIIFESTNPVHSLPESQKLRDAVRSLSCSVAIDVAMTETARECDYVLPAATNFEKWSATFFPRNFPANIFHLRAPLMDAAPNTLPEAEIHARLIEALQVFEEGELAPLQKAAEQGFEAYRQVFFEQMAQNPKISKMISYVLYRTLGPALGEGNEAGSAIWGLCQMYVLKHPIEAARAGFEGENAGIDLFNKIASSPSGTEIGVSTHEESFTRIPHQENKLQLVIGELLDEIPRLHDLQPLLETTADYPFVLVAGSRRAYTANCAIRDPRWIKGRQATALTVNPEDAQRLNIPEGATVLLETEAGKTTVELAFDERMHPGTLSVPNGQGMDFTDETGEELPVGVFANELTSVKYRDKFIGTPLHKHVPARISLV
jgi:anaerobic selenocysteine-containing dehydrogenase